MPIDPSSAEDIAFWEAFNPAVLAVAVGVKVSCVSFLPAGTRVK